MKLFKTASIDVVQDCQSYFAIDLPSCDLRRLQSDRRCVEYLPRSVAARHQVPCTSRWRHCLLSRKRRVVRAPRLRRSLGPNYRGATHRRTVRPSIDPRASSTGYLPIPTRLPTASSPPPPRLRHSTTPALRAPLRAPGRCN